MKDGVGMCLSGEDYLRFFSLKVDGDNEYLTELKTQ